MSTTSGRLGFLRGVITVQAVAVFSTSITAGLLLSTPGGHVFHSATSYLVFFVALLQLIAAILVGRSGGPRLPIRYSAGFLAGVLVQVALGLAGLKPLHMPLGMLLFGGIVFQLIWIWNHDRAPAQNITESTNG